MRCLFTGNSLDGCEPKSVEIKAGKEMLPFAHEYRRHGYVDLIDLAGGQVLTNCGNASPIRTSLPLAAAFAVFKADSTPSVTK